MSRVLDQFTLLIRVAQNSVVEGVTPLRTLHILLIIYFFSYWEIKRDVIGTTCLALF